MPKKFIDKAREELDRVTEVLDKMEGVNMVNKYGYALNKWNKAKEEMKQILKEAAKMQRRIPYSVLVNMVKTVELQPESYALADMLGEISREENAAGRGMLSAIVTHKSGDMQPGPGFFELAAELGRDTSDILKCWVEEFNRVHAYWSAK